MELDVRDSIPDWGPHTPKKAPVGAPNILIVSYEHTGLAAWPGNIPSAWGWQPPEREDDFLRKKTN